MQRSIEFWFCVRFFLNSRSVIVAFESHCFMCGVRSGCVFFCAPRFHHRPTATTYTLRTHKYIGRDQAGRGVFRWSLYAHCFVLCFNFFDTTKVDSYCKIETETHSRTLIYCLNEEYLSIKAVWVCLYTYICVFVCVSYDDGWTMADRQVLEIIGC